MLATAADLQSMGRRLALVRRDYGEAIDLPELDAASFANMLGVPAKQYEQYERGQAEPTAGFLIALRRKTGVSLDRLMDTELPPPYRSLGWGYRIYR